MLLAAALLAALQDPAPAAVAPRALGWDDFPVFVWRETYAGKPLPEELAEPFGGVILMREEDSAWARERGLAYLVWNVAGRDALHLDADAAWEKRVEDWIKTQDPKLLVREPCLNDPKTIERLEKTLDATLAKHGENKLSLVLGDEVALTPNGDPFDLCRCNFCEAEWKVFAAKHRWPDRAPLTDEVRQALLADDFSNLGAWLARRRFDQEQVTSTVLELREHVLQNPRRATYGYTADAAWPRRSDKRTFRFGVLGSGGLVPFGTFDLARWSDLLEFVEAYPRADAREQLTHPQASMGAPRGGSFPRAATLATVFVDQETPDGAAWRIWDHWLRGGAGVVLWSDTALEKSPAHRERIARAVQDIRDLSDVRLPVEQNEGALVYDADSVAAAWLRDALLDGPTWPRRRAGYQAEHGTRERKVNSWLRWIEDAGRMPAAIPLASLRFYGPHDFAFLVLPEVLVVGDDDVKELEKFVAAGGRLYVDGLLGWVDRRGQRRTEDVFGRLHASAPERVLRAPAEMASYLETRLSPGRADARAQARSTLDGWMEERGRRSPWTVLPDLGAEARALPWLVARGSLRQEERDDLPIFALLPNLTTHEERKQLRDLRLEDPDKEVIWIHPKPGEPLRAGDAAVFRSIRYKTPR